MLSSTLARRVTFDTEVHPASLLTTMTGRLLLARLAHRRGLWTVRGRSAEAITMAENDMDGRRGDGGCLLLLRRESLLWSHLPLWYHR